MDAVEDGDLKPLMELPKLRKLKLGPGIGADVEAAVVAVDESGELALAAVTGNALFASVRPPP